MSEALDSLPIIDAHAHFWDLDSHYYPWLHDTPLIPFRYGDYSAIRRSYLPADYRQDTRNFTRRGTGIMDSDYSAAARAMGFEAVRVETEEGLKEALNRAITSGGPWVIDAAINPDGYLAAKDVRPE